MKIYRTSVKEIKPWKYDINILHVFSKVKYIFLKNDPINVNK